MAKTLRTSGNYTIKAGTGSGGSHTIDLDSSNVRIRGNLNIDGTQTVINSTILSIEDKFLEVNRNNSTADTEDSGIFFNRGTSNAALLYWDAVDNEFLVGTTSDTATATTISNITLANLKVATSPTATNHAASKAYVDSVSGGAILTGSTNNTVTTVTGSDTIQGEANLLFDGTTLTVTGNITATTSIANDAISINDNAITTTRSNDDLKIDANGTGNVKINGIDFLTSGVMISKSKATALAIALG